MRRSVVFGLAGVAVVWGLIAWIRAHGLLDFFTLLFIVVSVLSLSYVTVRIVRGASHG